MPHNPRVLPSFRHEVSYYVEQPKGSFLYPPANAMLEGKQPFGAMTKNGKRENAKVGSGRFASGLP